MVEVSSERVGEAILRKKLALGVCEIIEEHSLIDIEAGSIDPNADFMDDLGIDSLAMVHMAVDVEDWIGIKVPDIDLRDLRTISKVVDFAVECIVEEVGEDRLGYMADDLGHYSPEHVAWVRRLNRR